MNVRYQFGVVYFCTDLTDSECEYIPVGLVASSDGWIFLGVSEAPASVPDLAALLRKTIERGRKEAPPGNLLVWLREQFGNRMTISISAPETREVELRSEGILQDLMQKLAALSPRSETPAPASPPFVLFEPLAGVA